MLIFHQFSLEIVYADSFLANQNRANTPVKEIIELDENDDEIMDGSHGIGTRGLFRMTPKFMNIF